MNRLSGLTNAAPTVCAACRSLVSGRLVKSFSQMRSGALKAVRGLQSRLPNSRGYPTTISRAFEAWALIAVNRAMALSQDSAV